MGCGRFAGGSRRYLKLNASKELSSGFVSSVGPALVGVGFRRRFAFEGRQTAVAIEGREGRLCISKENSVLYIAHRLETRDEIMLKSLMGFLDFAHA